MLVDLKGSKSGPKILTPTKEQKTKKSQKIFTQLFGSTRKGKMEKPGLLPNHPKLSLTGKQKSPSHDSGSGENDNETDFQGG